MTHGQSDPLSVLSMPRIPVEPNRRRRMVLTFVGAGVLVLLMAIYLILAFSTGNRVPGGTTVAGVDIGGLGRAEATRTLRTELGPQQGKPITVAAGGEEFEVDPAKAGLRFDAEATTEQAYVETTFNPIELVSRLGSGDEIQPIVQVDEKKLAGVLKGLAKEVDRDPVEGKIAFRGTEPKARMPEHGHTLRQKDAARTLREMFLTARGPVDLPTDEVATEVTEDEVKAAMADFAEPAVSAPVTIRFVGGADGEGSREEKEKDVTIEASPKEIAAALAMPIVDGEFAPELKPNKLMDALAGKLAEVMTTPEDARIEMTDSGPRVVPGKPGRTAEPKKLAAAVLPALTESGDARYAEVDSVESEPELTTKKLEALGVKEVTGEFTTYFPYANYRNVNIGRAAELMNGTLVLPDEEFSLNGTVGERTEENGFTGGYVIKGGSLAVELGGGVSQTATTMYNAAFFAGMEDVEHRAHGFYISRYPVGREATVYWGSLDLRWRNNTPYAVYVQSFTNHAQPGGQGSVTFRLWSTKYWDVETSTSDRYNIVPFEEIENKDKTGCVDQPSGVDGFTVDVHRNLYRDGELVEKETDVVKYNPEHKIKCKFPTNPPG